MELDERAEWGAYHLSDRVQQRQGGSWERFGGRGGGELMDCDTKRDLIVIAIALAIITVCTLLVFYE